MVGAGPAPCKILCVALSTLFQVLPRAIVSIVVQFQWWPSVARSAPRGGGIEFSNRCPLMLNIDLGMVFSIRTNASFVTFAGGQ